MRHANVTGKESNGKVKVSNVYATKLKAVGLTNVKEVGLTFFRLYPITKLSIFIFIYETNPSVENFLRNTTSQTINMTEIFNPSIAK